MGKHKVLISGIAIAVIGVFVVFAMPESAPFPIKNASSPHSIFSGFS